MARPHLSLLSGISAHIPFHYPVLTLLGLPTTLKEAAGCSSSMCHQCSQEGMGFVPWPPRPHNQLPSLLLPERFLGVPGGKGSTSRVRKQDSFLCQEMQRRSWLLLLKLDLNSAKIFTGLGVHSSQLTSLLPCHTYIQYGQNKCNLSTSMLLRQRARLKTKIWSFHIKSTFSPLSQSTECTLSIHAHLFLLEIAPYMHAFTITCLITPTQSA